MTDRKDETFDQKIARLRARKRDAYAAYWAAADELRAALKEGA